MKVRTLIRRLTTSALFLTLTLTAFAAGCKDRDAIVVRKVLVDVEPASLRLNTKENLSREGVRTMVMKALREESKVKLALESNEGDVLRVRVLSQTLGMRQDLTIAGSLSVALELNVKDGDVLFGSATQAFGNKEGTQVESFVSAALNKAVLELADARSMSSQSSELLLSKLNAKESSYQQNLRIINVLGTRKETKALPALKALLKSKDEETVLATIRALTNLSDARVVPDVIVASERFERAERVALRAARVLGGRYAASWLFTLSTGHPDVTMRKSAKDALALLESEKRVAKVVMQGEDAKEATP